MDRKSNLVVNKILEGSNIRKVLSEGANTYIRIDQFVDQFFDDTVDFYVGADEFVWYDALLACSKKVKADFDKTFDPSDWDWDEWFGKHWGFYVDYDFDGVATAPDCDKAGVSSDALTDFVRKNNDLDCVTMYHGHLYLVAKPD